MAIERLWRFTFAIALVAALSLVSNAAAKPRIRPLRTSLAFSAQSAENRLSVPINSTDGNPVYVLSLEPDFDVGHHIVVLELVLRGPHDKTDAPNRLDPTGRAHGYQAYIFGGRDFTQGAKKSLYGEKRTVFLKNLGLVVQITVSKATVSPVSADGYQFDALTLQVEVDNSGP
jgi:hypothetical protein